MRVMPAFAAAAGAAVLALIGSPAGAAPAAVLAPVPAGAVPATPASADSARLIDAIVGQLDLNQVIGRVTEQLIDKFAEGDPAVSAGIAAEPALRGRIKAVIEPQMKIWVDRNLALKRPVWQYLIASNMTGAEARQIADFYFSPLGRRFIAAAARNVTAANVLDAAARHDRAGLVAAGSRDLEAGKARAVTQLIPTLTPAERVRIVRLAGAPAMRKLNERVLPPMMRSAMTLEPEIFHADEVAGLRGAIRALIDPDGAPAAAP